MSMYNVNIIKNRPKMKCTISLPKKAFILLIQEVDSVVLSSDMEFAIA